MHKFFVNRNSIIQNRIYIGGEDVAHINKVLRLKKNDKVLVSDGYGMEYICFIIEAKKDMVTCEISEKFQNVTEPGLNITLFQGLPKSQKMDLIVQKCVEIGVSKIQPVITERVVVKLENRDINNKIERWNRIAEEASKQSNRGIIPEVLTPINFNEAIRQLKAMDLAVVPFEGEKNTGLKVITDRLKGSKKAGILIGPEGGFDEDEIIVCKENNVIAVTLGPRILRTETAGFVAASILLYEAGDMGGNI